jgi:hypothetical protein
MPWGSSRNSAAWLVAVIGASGRRDQLRRMLLGRLTGDTATFGKSPPSIGTVLR